MLSYRMIIVGKPLEKLYIASNSWIMGTKTHCDTDKMILDDLVSKRLTMVVHFAIAFPESWRSF